jgi:predicted nucleic acid-binding protein
MVSFDTNILVYATASISDMRVMRARDLIARAMRAASSILLLQTLAEFSNVAIRKARIPVEDIRITVDAWRAVLPVQAADNSDLSAALDAVVRAHRLAFWDAMLWASAQRAGVRHLLTEDMQDGFTLQGVTFIDPFKRENDQLIDEVLPPS